MAVTFSLLGDNYCPLVQVAFSTNNHLSLFSLSNLNKHSSQKMAYVFHLRTLNLVYAQLKYR
ncbi:hypothetical protein QQP08_005948, partial [Theobroma cacao]